MNIVTVPHPALRQIASPIDTLDKKTHKFLRQLAETLDNGNNPRGVGLSAPQVDINLRAFVTKADNDHPEHAPMRLFINPVLTNHSPERIFGDTSNRNKRIEGCLSIPKLFGPVPRWQWIEVSFATLDAQGNLVTQEERFSAFPARVVQHELDHLDGVLFTDYSLEYDLPVYVEVGDELEEFNDRTALTSY